MSLGISFWLGLVVRSYPTSEDIIHFVVTIGNFVIGGFSVGVGVEAMGFLGAWYTEKKRVERENADKQEKNRLEHSETLIGALSLGSIDVVCEEYDSKPDLHIPSQKQRQSTLSILNYNMYSEDVRAHLRTGIGYKQLWSDIEKRESDIDQYNIDLKTFVDSLNQKILSGLERISPDIIEWDRMTQPPPAKYYTKYLLIEIGWHVTYAYTRKVNFEIFYTPASSQLSLSNTLIKNTNETEIQKTKEMITDAFNSAINGDFQILKKSFSVIEMNHYIILKKFQVIIKDVKNKVPLDGYCETQGFKGWAHKEIPTIELSPKTLRNLI